MMIRSVDFSSHIHFLAERPDISARLCVDFDLCIVGTEFSKKEFNFKNITAAFFP